MRERGFTDERHKEAFGGGVDIFTIPTVLMVSQACTYSRTYQVVCFKWTVYCLSMRKLLHANDTSIKLLKFSKFLYWTTARSFSAEFPLSESEISQCQKLQTRNHSYGMRRESSVFSQSDGVRGWRRTSWLACPRAFPSSFTCETAASDGLTSNSKASWHGANALQFSAGQIWTWILAPPRTRLSLVNLLS